MPMQINISLYMCKKKEMQDSRILHSSNNLLSEQVEHYLHKLSCPSMVEKNYKYLSLTGSYNVVLEHREG